MRIETIAKIVASASIKVMSRDEFLKLSGDLSLIKAMTNVPTFTVEDVGSLYIVLAGAEQDEDTGWWTFPMYNASTSTPVTVSSLKLKGTVRKGTTMNWFADSKGPDGMVKAFKFVAFTEDKAGKNPVFPRQFYRAEVIAEHFDVTEDTVVDLVDSNYFDLKGPEKTRRNKWLRWAKKQPIRDILLEEHLTKSGNATADALKRRFGTLTYEVVERVSLT